MTVRFPSDRNRGLLAWTRLVKPNGHSIVLERQPGADTQGFASLGDEVDRHWGRLFCRGRALVGAEFGTSNTDSDIVRGLRRGSSGGSGVGLSGCSIRRMTDYGTS